MKREPDLLAVKDKRKFQVHCEAGIAGQFTVGTDTLSVVIGQRVRVKNQEEMWDSVHIICKEEQDRSLTVELYVCHPDWAEPRKITVIRSKPSDRESPAVLTVEPEQRNP